MYCNALCEDSFFYVPGDHPGHSSPVYGCLSADHVVESHRDPVTAEYAPAAVYVLALAASYPAVDCIIAADTFTLDA